MQRWLRARTNRHPEIASRAPRRFGTFSMGTDKSQAVNALVDDDYQAALDLFTKVSSRDRKASLVFREKPSADTLRTRA